MNHLRVDVLVASTAALPRPPPPHQLEDVVNQVLLKSPEARHQMNRHNLLHNKSFGRKKKSEEGGGSVVVGARNAPDRMSRQRTSRSSSHLRPWQGSLRFRLGRAAGGVKAEEGGSAQDHCGGARSRDGSVTMEGPTQLGLRGPFDMDFVSRPADSWNV